MSGDRWRQMCERVAGRAELSRPSLAEFAKGRLELYPDEGYAIVIAPNERYADRYSDLVELHIGEVTRRHWQVIVLTERQLQDAERQEPSRHAKI